MKYTLIPITLVLIGCASSPNLDTIDEVVPEETIHIPGNVADSNGKWDGSKGQFPPGRVINYKGHGTDYTINNNHINHHTHHGHGGLGYHND